MSLNTINVLLPIETINREIDSRLFLAVQAARPGYRFFIGQHDVVTRLASFMQGGLFVGERIVQMELPTEKGTRYRALKAHGFRVIFLDEEGGVYLGNHDGWVRSLLVRLDPALLEPEDYHCTWGRAQRDVFLSRKPRNADRIRVTGHPRFDLYKPGFRAFYEEQIVSIEKRFKPFILINTNLSLPNNALGLADSFSPRQHYNAADLKNREYWVGAWAHGMKLLAHFVALVSALSAALRGINIVVRPHPSEDASFYRTVFKGIPNVHVVHEGSVGGWIFACDVLIHNGCTTAIEAYLAGKHVISYQPVMDDRFDLPLPNSLGVRCSDESGVIEAVRAALHDGRRSETDPGEPAKQVLHNFGADSFADFMVVLNAAMDEVFNLPRSYDERGFHLSDAARRAGAAGKFVARQFLPERRHRARAFSAMFYGLNAKVIDQKLRIIQRLLGKRVRRKYHHAELMSLEVA